MTEEFQIGFLDHVAIRVKDIEVSAKWYEDVLGLKRYRLKEWGPFPVFLLAGRSGVAIFPADGSDPEIPISKNVRIDHFAFNVNKENFKLARKRYEEMGIEYRFEDHHYFHSIYAKDPDGHVVELTTIVVNEKEFYDP